MQRAVQVVRSNQAHHPNSETGRAAVNVRDGLNPPTLPKLFRPSVAVVDPFPIIADRAQFRSSQRPVARRDSAWNRQRKVRWVASSFPWAKPARAEGMWVAISIWLVPMAARESASGVITSTWLRCLRRASTWLARSVPHVGSLRRPSNCPSGSDSLRPPSGESTTTFA
jgi:hypothetical protein